MPQNIPSKAKPLGSPRCWGPACPISHSPLVFLALQEPAEKISAFLGAQLPALPAGSWSLGLSFPLVLLDGVAGKTEGDGTSPRYHERVPKGRCSPRRSCRPLHPRQPEKRRSRAGRGIAVPCADRPETLLALRKIRGEKKKKENQLPGEPLLRSKKNILSPVFFCSHQRADDSSRFGSEERSSVCTYSLFFSRLVSSHSTKFFFSMLSTVRL